MSTTTTTAEVEGEDTTTTTTEEETTIETTTRTTTTTTTTTTVTTTTTTTTGCFGETEILNFFDSTLEHSNLGGAGPDAGVPNIRYTAIGTFDGQPYDIVVEATSAYQA